MSAGKKPFTPETAPRNGRPKGSRNKTPPKAVLESIVAHVCELRGKARIQRIRKAMDALFISDEAGYVKVGMEAAVRLHQIEQGAQLGDSAPMHLIVRWGSPSKPVPLPETASPVSSPVSPSSPSPLPTMTPASPAKLLTFHRLSD